MDVSRTGLSDVRAVAIEGVAHRPYAARGQLLQASGAIRLAARQLVAPVAARGIHARLGEFRPRVAAPTGPRHVVAAQRHFVRAVVKVEQAFALAVDRRRACARPAIRVARVV